MNTNNGDNIAVVLDEDDVTSTDTTTELKSVNLITGTTVGTWIVVPGAFFSDNFDIHYELGSLTILPATLTVTADDQNLACFAVSYTHLRAHETVLDLECRLLL